MIYHLSLQNAGFICSLILLVYAGFAFLKPDLARGAATKFPRDFISGVLLLTVDLVWCFWLLSTMEMGEFSSFRRPLLIALPIGYFLILKFVNEFLVVRALGIFCLLAAEPLLDAAFFRDEPTRLLITVFAYIIVIAGLFWVATPYVLRDQISWSARTPARWRVLHAVLFLYGAAILACTLIRY